MAELLRHFDGHGSVNVAYILGNSPVRISPPGGVLIVCETLIDDARRSRSHSLLASLNMVLQTEAGFEFTAAECISWMREVGFQTMSIMPLAAFYSAIIAEKPTAPT